jgi:fibronectin-binding autotransporter adhesin
MRTYRAFVLSLMLLGGQACLEAAPLYFNPATTAWDQGIASNWSLASGGPFNQTWTSGTAVFEGTATTVNVSGTITTVEGIQFSTAGYILNGGTLNLVGTPTITNTDAATINSVLTGSVGFAKSGAGALSLGGVNTYTGVTAINQGTVVLGNAAALGATGSGNETTIADGATLNLNGISLGTGSHNSERLNLAGTVTNTSTTADGTMRHLTITGNNAAIIGSRRIDVRGQNNTTNRGVVNLGAFTLTKGDTNKFSIVDTDISGTGGIVLNSGTLAFTRSIMTTGSVTINNGTLEFENNSSATNHNYEMPIAMNGGSMTSSGGSTFGALKSNISFTGQRDISVAADTVFTLSGTLTGTGGFRKMGAGTLVITNTANNYATAGGTNRTQINAGVLAVVPTAIVGTGTNQIEFSAAGATLQSFNTNTLTLNNEINVSNSAFLGSATTGNLELNGSVALGGAAKTLTINNALTSMNGILTGNTSAFTKAGTGILAINGTANTSTKPLLVTEGTLGGIGNYNGPVTIAAIATLAPGNSVGTLTINSSLTLNGLANFELNATSPGLNTSDRAIGISALTYGGNLQVSAASGTFDVGQSWQLFSAATPSGTFANNNTFGTAGDGVFLPTLSSGIWQFDYGSGTLSIAPVAIPEPGTLAVCGIVGLIFWNLRRKSN